MFLKTTKSSKKLEKQDEKGTIETMKTTIGIEVHAELNTKTKMFCGSCNDPHAAKPNTHICPVCLAHPGTLPVINREAVKHVIKVGKAIEGSIASFTEFDRKNYFYPDIPKGYQISQYKYPIVSGGELAGVAITRVHLEEDTARSIHDGDRSFIDYNRAGVPLMELVTEPVIHDAETAVLFAKELQLLLRVLNVSDANMEKGEMRVEVNVSVSPDNTLGTKVEVKNINSFKAVESSIIYEIKRQTDLIEKGEKVVQETRGWDENKGKTVSQRVKESAEDYRYFPDPDLPKLDISRLEVNVPELPAEKRLKYSNLGIPRNQIEVIISDTDLRTFFDRLIVENIHPEQAVLAGNYLTSDLQALVAENEDLVLENAHMETFIELIDMVYAGLVTSRVAKDLLREVVFDGKDPKVTADERGLLQKNSEDELQSVVDTLIVENPSVVEEFRSGKEAVIQFLVGQGMKMTKGTANPTLLQSLLEKSLKQ